MVPRLICVFSPLLWSCASDIKIAPRDDSSEPVFALDVQPQSWTVEAAVGQSASQRFNLIVNQKLELLSASLDEPDTGEESPWSLSMVLDPPIVLSAGSELSMTVSFAPAEVHSYESSLMLSSTEENWTIELVGTGCEDCPE